MSNVEPPPESKQLIATGGSVQADQSIKWDFLKQQTVTLTLNLNDILKNENQALLNDCEFSVSGRMAFGCKSCKTSQMASALEDLKAESSDSATQPLQQPSLDPGKQEVVDSINKNKTTLNEASSLLLKCVEHLENMKATLDNPPGERNEDLMQEVKCEVKGTTSKVIKLLKKLGKDTGTVDSNDDDDDNPSSDDEDSDGSDETIEDPTKDDSSQNPTNPPEKPSKKDEVLTGNQPTDLAQEQDEHESTEFFDAAIGSQEKQAKLSESASASEMNKQEIGEDQKQGEDDSEPQQMKAELGGSSEESPEAGSDSQQADVSPQQPSTLGVPPLSESSANQELQEELKETSPEDVGASPSVKDENEHDVSSLPASEVDKKEGDSAEIRDAGSDPAQHAKLSQESSAPAESPIEHKPDDNEAPLLAKEVVEDEQQGGDESGMQTVGSKKSEEAPGTGSNPQHETELPQHSSTLVDPLLSESPSVSRVEKKEEPLKDTPDAGLISQNEAERPQEPPIPTESAIEETSVDNKTPLLDKEEVVEDEQQGGDKSGMQTVGSEKFEEAPSTGSNPQHEDGIPQDPSIPAVPVIEEPATSDRVGNDGNEDNLVAKPNVGEQVQSAGNVQPEGPQLTKRQIRNKAKNKKNTEKKKTDQAVNNPVVDNTPVVEKENDRGDVSLDVMLFALFAEMNDIRKNRTGINDIELPELLKGISLFHRKDYYKQHANVIPEVVFKKLLGDEWEEKEGTGSEICRKLAYFSTHETSKTSAQDMVAYLHHHHQKAPNPKQKSPKGKVISMDDLFSKFIKEICIWSDDHWVARMLGYAKYQTEELSKQDKDFIWKKPPPMYNNNLCVLDRLDYHETNLEANKTFENQLIVDCYNYLISQEPRFIGFHNLLNFDLDYICTRSKASIDNIEWKFFSTVFGFDATTLMKPEEVTDKSEKPETSSVPEESTPSSESHPGEPEKAAIVPCEPEISEHNFVMFFTLIKAILAKTDSFEDPTSISLLLLDFSLFHKSANWKKYKTLTPNSVTLKLFGPKEEWENKNEPGHKFCRLMEMFFEQRVYHHSAHKMLASLEHFVMKDSNKMESRESLANQFATLIDAEVCEWLRTHRRTRLDNYVQYLEKRRENFEGPSKYCWKPKPPSFKTSPRFKEILAFHQGNLEESESRYSSECYEILQELDDKRSELLDDDLDFIFTRPAKLLEETEKMFFIVACHKPKLTNFK